MIEMRNVTLRDGTLGYVRRIVPSDGAALDDPAPDSRMRRFLFEKTSLSERELCSGIVELVYAIRQPSAKARPLGWMFWYRLCRKMCLPVGAGAGGVT